MLWEANTAHNRFDGSGRCSPDAPSAPVPPIGHWSRGALVRKLRYRDLRPEPLLTSCKFHGT
jgi:hypothetical protein